MAVALVVVPFLVPVTNSIWSGVERRMRPLKSCVSASCVICLLQVDKSLVLHKGGAENHLGYEHLGEGEVPERRPKGLSPLFKELFQYTSDPSWHHRFCVRCRPPQPHMPRTSRPGPPPHTQEAVPARTGEGLLWSPGPQTSPCNKPGVWKGEGKREKADSIKG